MPKANFLKITSPLYMWFILATIVFVADQWVKSLVIENILLYEKIKVNFFINLTHQQNPGAAFSFLADAGGWQRWFLSILAILVCLYIIFWLTQLEAEKKNMPPLWLSSSFRGRAW
jgi:signal peptidase II